MFNKVLLAQDERSEHLPTLEKAARLVSRGGHLEMFCSVYQPLLKSTGMFDPEAERRSRHAYLMQSEGRLDHLAERLRLPEVEVGTDVAWDERRARGVLRKCVRYRPDLMLYPLSPQHGMLHHLLAPEDWQVLRDCPVPLLLSHDRPWGEHLRIAVAINPFPLKGEPESFDSRLFRFAHQLAALLKAELHVVHSYAFESVPQAVILDEERLADSVALQAHVRERHEQKLRDLLAPWAGEPGAAELHVIEGELERVLPTLCHQQQIDLLLMGDVHRGVLEHLLLGSSAERVLDRIVCDLMVLKPEGFQCPIGE